MAFDVISRSLAVRALKRLVRSPEDGGGGAGVAPARNRQAIRDALVSVGTDKLALVAGSYALDSISASDTVTLHRQGQQPSILVPAGLKQFDLRGGELKMANSRGIFATAYQSYAYPCLRSYLAADVAAGDVTLSLATGEGTKWAVGDEFLYRLGSYSYDKPEALQWGFAKVRAIAGDALTIDAPMSAPFALASVDGVVGDGSDALSFTGEFGEPGARNKSLHRWPLHQDLEVCNGAITGDLAATSEIALIVNGGRRISFRNIVVRYFGAGFGLQYVENATISQCAVIDCNPIQISLGKGIGLSETRGVRVDNCYFEGLRTCIGIEAGGEAWVCGGRFHNTGNVKTKVSYGSDCTAFVVQGNAQMVVRDFTITGHGGYKLALTGNGAPEYDGRIRFEGRLTLIHATLPAALAPWEDMNCLLDMTIAGTREIWDFTQARWFRRRFLLKNGTSGVYFNLPAGIVKAAQVYASSGIAAGDVTGLFLARPGNNGPSYAGALVPGQQIRIVPSTATADLFFAQRSQPLRLAINTAAGTSLDAGDQFVDISCLVVPNLLAASTGLTDFDARNLGETIRTARFAGITIPAIAAGATWQGSYPIAAMAVGDLIETVSHNPNRGGVTIRDCIAAPGGCVVLYENRGTSATTAQTTTMIVAWRKPPTDG